MRGIELEPINVSVFLIEGEEIIVKEYVGYIELYKKKQKICTVRTIRFSEEAEAYRKAVIELFVRNKIQEEEQLEGLRQIARERGGEEKWIIMN